MKRSCVGTALVVLAGLASVAGAEDFDKALSAYRSWIKRPSLHKRTLGRERLASTQDMRALQILAQSYGKPEAPRDQVQYLIVNIAADFYAESEHLPIYAAWREKHRKPQDAWLWYQSLIPHLENAGPQDLLAIARNERDVCLRAAAIEALRFRQDPAVLELIPELAEKLPTKKVARALILESLTAALYTQRDKRSEEVFRVPAEALIRRMDEDATLPRTRIVMGRYLSRTFGVKYVWRSGKRWMAELNQAQHGSMQGSLKGYATFAGIEATGDRICYVIDMSDSMLTPLTPRVIEKLPKGPVSGVNARVREEKLSKNAEWKKAFAQVKWDKVKNRFDAARELLKASLVGLKEDQYYAVMWFGDGAGLLNSTKGLRKATLKSVRATMRELDSIRPGSKKRNRPHGTLRGATNMHGGLHRAFKLRGSGLVGAYEYVNPRTWSAGCDTIFLLTDGVPTWDDWPNQDRKDPLDRAGDPESGHKTNDAPTLNFPGPYRRTHHLLEDVRRLNLFRKVEIHCVGMGEANMNTLSAIASIGKGEALNLTGK